MSLLFYRVLRKFNEESLKLSSYIFNIKGYSRSKKSGLFVE